MASEVNATRITGAALVLLGYVAVLLAVWQIVPPTAGNLAVSDPLVRLIDARAGLWFLPVLCVLPAIGWLAAFGANGEERGRAVRAAALGALVAIVGLTLLRAAAGPVIPSFIPPEESAGPGLVLGLGAGLVEEAVFRLGILAPSYLIAGRSMSERSATTFAVVLTALLFALSHEVGPGATTFEPRFFITRFLVPGVGMSLLFLWLGPAFLVSLHAAAHVAIAMLFTAGL